MVSGDNDSSCPLNYVFLDSMFQRRLIDSQLAKFCRGPDLETEKCYRKCRETFLAIVSTENLPFKYYATLSEQLFKPSVAKDDDAIRENFYFSSKLVEILH